jgi:LPS O-antigen subunit length determinant protein (WzzB/FepE family)
MQQEQLTFNLYDVVRIALKYKKHIAIFTIIAALGTAAYAMVLKNQYRSYANFYPSNAMIASRDHLFRMENQDALDQFGFEHEQDRMITIGNCSPLMQDLVNKYNLYKHYGYDTLNDPLAKQKTFKLFNKRYEVSKGSYGNVELYVIDEDKELASQIANDALTAIQDQFREFYINSHRGIAQALEVQMHKQDSVITYLTDTLIKVRKKYSVYDVLSPSRKAATNVRSTSAEGIEYVQNLEEIKDKYVIDRARYESICNEFKTVDHKSIPFLQVVQYPTPSGQKDSPFRTLMVLGAAAAALVLGILLAFIAEYFQTVKHKFA